MVSAGPDGERVEVVGRDPPAGSGLLAVSALQPRSLEAVDRLLREHHGEKRNHGHALWTLLTLEVFLRREG